MPPDFAESPLRSRARAFRKWSREYKLYNRILPIAFLIGVALSIIYNAAFAAPQTFATPAVIVVKPNETLAQVGNDLKAAHAIRSARLFEFLVRSFGGNKLVKEGSYFFPAPQNVFKVALRFRTGDFELTPARVSITEDMDVREIGDLLAKKLAPFDEKSFLAAASSSEGMLYPDTYFFYPDQNPEDIVKAMETNFNNHIETASSTIATSGHSLHDLLTMASILVGEAQTDHDRRIVSGILWKRISIGMPLQVDAPFGYILDKPLTELKPDDLKIDSPYNTYLNKGLPPTPIGNPSLQAILEAATPTKTSYLYYLSDSNGNMHFSDTFAAHKNQIHEYLVN